MNKTEQNMLMLMLVGKLHKEETEYSDEAIRKSFDNIKSSNSVKSNVIMLNTNNVNLKNFVKDNFVEHFIIYDNKFMGEDKIAVSKNLDDITVYFTTDKRKLIVKQI